MDESDWRNKLSQIETLEEFEALEPYIEDAEAEDLDYINSPEILRVFIVKYSIDPVEGFYVTFDNYRIDFFEVFFSFFTLRELIGSDVIRFSFLLNNVIDVGAVDVMVFLLDKGLNVDFMLDIDEGTGEEPILSVACGMGRVDIVTLLLQREANANLRNFRGETPAFYAIWSGNVSILDHLIVHGANLTLCDEDGSSLWSTTDDLTIMQRLVDMRVPMEDAIVKEIERCLPLSEEKDSLQRILDTATRR